MLKTSLHLQPLSCGGANRARKLPVATYLSYSLGADPPNICSNVSPAKIKALLGFQVFL
jgi:hypothetical protein